MADLGTIKSPVHDHAGELLMSKSATVELIEPSNCECNDPPFFKISDKLKSIASQLTVIFCVCTKNEVLDKYH